MESHIRGDDASVVNPLLEDAVTRKVFDCRELPGECTLTISGTEDEVLDAQALHAVSVHDQHDGPELRDFIRASLRGEVPA